MQYLVTANRYTAVLLTIVVGRRPKAFAAKFGDVSIRLTRFHTLFEYCEQRLPFFHSAADLFQSTTLGLARLSRKFLRNLRYGSERPKVDERCGRVSKVLRFQAPKGPIPWKYARPHAPESADPYEKNQDFV